MLGTYGFDKNGDTTLKSYGLYKVGSDGEPVFVKTITPTKTVGLANRGGGARRLVARRSGAHRRRPRHMAPHFTGNPWKPERFRRRPAARGAAARWRRSAASAAAGA